MSNKILIVTPFLKEREKLEKIFEAIVEKGRAIIYPQKL